MLMRIVVLSLVILSTHTVAHAVEDRVVPPITIDEIDGYGDVSWRLVSDQVVRDAARTHGSMSEQVGAAIEARLRRGLAKAGFNHVVALTVAPADAIGWTVTLDPGARQFWGPAEIVDERLDSEVIQALMNQVPHQCHPGQPADLMGSTDRQLINRINRHVRSQPDLTGLTATVTWDERAQDVIPVIGLAAEDAAPIAAIRWRGLERNNAEAASAWLAETLGVAPGSPADWLTTSRVSEALIEAGAFLVVESEVIEELGAHVLVVTVVEHESLRLLGTDPTPLEQAVLDQLAAALAAFAHDSDQGVSVLIQQAGDTGPSMRLSIHRDAGVVMEWSGPEGPSWMIHLGHESVWVARNREQAQSLWHTDGDAVVMGGLELTTIAPDEDGDVSSMSMNLSMKSRSYWQGPFEWTTSFQPAVVFSSISRFGDQLTVDDAGSIMSEGFTTTVVDGAVQRLTVVLEGVAAEVMIHDHNPAAERLAWWQNHTENWAEPDPGFASFLGALLICAEDITVDLPADVTNSLRPVLGNSKALYSGVLAAVVDALVSQQAERAELESFTIPLPGDTPQRDAFSEGASAILTELQQPIREHYPIGSWPERVVAMYVDFFDGAQQLSFDRADALLRDPRSGPIPRVLVGLGLQMIGHPAYQSVIQHAISLPPEALASDLNALGLTEDDLVTWIRSIDPIEDVLAVIPPVMHQEFLTQIAVVNGDDQAAARQAAVGLVIGTWRVVIVPALQRMVAEEPAAPVVP